METISINTEFIRLQDLLIVEKKVQVQRPGTPVDQALPLFPALRLMEQVQKLMGGEQGLQLQTAV